MTGSRQGDHTRKAEFGGVSHADVECPKLGIEGRSVGDRWGGWRLTSNLVLQFEPGTWKDYWVDLQRITNVWEALDIIAHLIEKEWMTPQDLGDFIYALNDCIPLRERLLFRSEPYRVRSECPWLRQADNE